MINQNQYPMQGIAKQLQSQGRYGDSMLMHVNPAEVAGLASLMPGGQLTTNPQTGQPEAFLPMLIPLLASYGGSAAAGAMGAGIVGSAVAGGLASGVATGAITGDWERGLQAGIIGAAGGAALGKAGELINKVPLEGATELLAPEVMDAALGGAVGDAATSTVAGGFEQALLDAASEEATALAAREGALGMTQIGNDVIGSEVSNASLSKVAEQVANAAPAPTTGFGSGFDPSKFSGKSFTDALKQPFQKGSGLGKNLMSAKTVMPMAIGYGNMAQMDADEAYEKDTAKRLADDDAEREASYGRLQSAYASAQPDAQRGRSSLRDQPQYAGMPDWWKPEGYATGGQIRGGGGGYAGNAFGPYGWKSGWNGSGDIDPLTIQANQRGRYSVSPHRTLYDDDQYEYAEDQYEPTWNQPDVMRLIENAKKTLKPGAVGTPDPATAGYRAGFDPEFMYFQNDPENVVVPDQTTSAQKAVLYPELQRMEQSSEPYFDTFGATSPSPLPEDGKNPSSIWDDPSNPQPIRGIPVEDDNGMAGGGEVQLQTDYGPQSINGGGIAALPSEFINPQEQGAPMPPMRQPQADNPSPMVAQPEAGGEPSDQDIQQLALALTGKLGDQMDMVVERFIQEFGVETFREAREFILSFVNGGEAQTEGMVQGMGGGMDDMVPGTIGGQEEVAVSPGEYIIPADVVSGLGDGSSDAGASELDQMANRVRMARGGSTTQPPPFNASAVLPI